MSCKKLSFSKPKKGLPKLALLMNTTEWKESGHFFQFEEYDIFFKDNGNVNKPSLVLLHGFPTSSWDYWKMWKLLDAQFRLISLDFLGFGFSTKPLDIEYTFFQQTDITQALLQHLNVEDYHVIAHDYAVTVAQELLVRKNEGKNNGLQSICFLNGGLLAEVIQPIFIQKLILSPLGKLTPFFLGKNSLRKNFKKIFGPDTQATEDEIDEFWKLLSSNKGTHAFPLIIKYMNERKKYRDRWCVPLENPNIPVILINGNQDPISGKNITDRYLEINPKGKVINMPNIGHYPNTEAAEKVVRYYLDFFDKK